MPTMKVRSLSFGRRNEKQAAAPDVSQTAAQHSLHVVIQMYRRGIWRDAKTVNVVATALFCPHPKLRLGALHFLLGAHDLAADEADSDDEEAAEMERRRRDRSESRFDSISEELKALNSGLISEPSTVAEVDNRQPCPQCGRKFLPDRLQRHVKVCEDLKRGKEWRGTWKSPVAGGSRSNMLIEGRNTHGSSFKV